MTAQQKDLILNALRIGLDYIIADGTDESNNDDILRAAIKELEAMPTEVQPNGEIK